MKTKLLVMSFALATFGVMTSERIIAQTSVNLIYAGDSSWGPLCPTPYQAWFDLYGDAAGYNPLTDSITIYSNFGDGLDTTFKVPIYTGAPNYFYAYFYHTYTAPGIYSAQYIATAPDGKADTLTKINEINIPDSCGNISGKIYVDNNTNCVYDFGIDSVVRGFPVQLLSGSSVAGFSYTDSTGTYHFSAPSGTYTVEINNVNSYGYVASCPLSGSVSVNTSVNPVNDFGVVCQSSFDLVAGCSGWRFRPGMDGYVYPWAYNASCIPTSGTLTLTLDPLTSYVSSVIPPTSIVGNVITWDFSNLTNYDYWYWWNYFWDGVTVFTSASATIGDTVCFTVNVNPTVDDLNATNNTFTFCSAVRNSWDPNEKDVAPIGTGATGNVAPNTEFTYTLHFQNTGNATAYNIAVVDTLDSDLDMNTLHIESSTHFMQPDVLTGNVIKFNFPNILLPDSGTNRVASQGQVTYKISAKPGLTNGTQIKNTGYIYFDFNPAVVTNTTLNTIDIVLGVNQAEQEQNLIGVYPNPVNENFTVTLDEKLLGADVMLMDVLGNVVMNRKADAKYIVFNTTYLASGIYNLVVKWDSQTLTQRVSVAH